MDTKAYKKKKILVFAGTFEGHKLAEAFWKKGWQEKADFCVATCYGTELLEDIPGLSVMEGRLKEEDMKRLLAEGSYGMVIDATHPYAKEVTENIRKACGQTEVSYVRLFRERSGKIREGVTEVDSISEAVELLNGHREENIRKACGQTEVSYVRLFRERSGKIREGVTEVDSISEAVELLNGHRERVLLTTGAKELRKYSGISYMAERVFARVLPSAESIAACHNAGIPAGHIIAMQGPFSREMNLATMRQYGCTYLVTKDTGKPGGFDDKLAVLEAGFQVIVIRRPSAEQGDSFEEVMKKAEAFYEE